MKARITLNDTIMEILLKISEGNPGAAVVLTEMLEKGAIIDPDCFMGSLGAILSLDTHGIYGSRIWMLYKDVCGEDLVKTLGMLRAVQLGFLSERDLNTAIGNYGAGINVDDLLAQVKEGLPKFGVSQGVPEKTLDK